MKLAPMPTCFLLHSPKKEPSGLPSTTVYSAHAFIQSSNCCFPRSMEASRGRALLFSLQLLSWVSWIWGDEQFSGV